MIILHAAFEVAGEEAHWEGEAEVRNGEEDIAFKVAEGVGGDVFCVLGEFIDSDDRKKRGVFDEGHELSGERWKNRSKGLWKNDVPQCLGGGESDGGGGFKL